MEKRYRRSQKSLHWWETNLMRYVCVLLGFSLGLLFQGCTVQKRSHLPGWHVERATQRVGHRAAAMSSEVPEACVNVDAEPAEDACAVAVGFVPQVPPTPLPSLVAYVPGDMGAAELNLQMLDFSSSSCESPHVNHVVPEEGVEYAPKNSGGKGRVVWRMLLGVVAAALAAYGILFVQWGLAWWDGIRHFGTTYMLQEGSVPLFLLGVVLLEVAWRTLLEAFPKLRAWVPSWSDLKPSRPAREARREVRQDHLPPEGERRSAVGRVFMGLLAITLGIGSMPAFAMAFGWGVWPFALLGMGLVWLCLRALLEAFPKLRAMVDAWASPDAKQKRSTKRQERAASSPSSSQPWWRLSLPVLAIAAAYVIVAALTGKIG